MSLKRGIATGEYYHVFNRGAHRFPIFKEKADVERFLFSLLYLQSSVSFENKSRIVNSFSEKEGYPVADVDIEKILRERAVELVAFCIMPNHFHLLVRETKEGGLSAYMQRILDGYTKYFHAKHGASGHVFQGRYKSVLVKDDRQLMHLSAYIHRNPRELSAWRGNEFVYPWSSLQDFTGANRWGGLLATDIIASHFDAKPNSNYADFVKTSPAKMLMEEFGAYTN